MVPLGAQLEHGAAEQVELDRHLGAGGRVRDAHQLVRREDLVRVVHEVEHGDEVVIADGLESLQRQLSLLLQGDVVTGEQVRSNPGRCCNWGTGQVKSREML